MDDGSDSQPEPFYRLAPHQQDKQPRHVKSKPYLKANSYSKRASIKQILTLVLIALHLAYHSAVIVRPIIEINQLFLYFLLTLFYLFLCVMIIDYCLITCGDPGDSLLRDQRMLIVMREKQKKFELHKMETSQINDKTRKETENPYRLKFCSQCQKAVLKTSYHCWTCKMCIDNLDHHCKYLNNCIGRKNYYPFFRLLLTTTAYLLLSISHAVWVFIMAFQDKQVELMAFSRWAVLVFMIFAVALLIGVDSLLVFHCYISCYRDITTLEYIFQESSAPQNKQKRALQQNNKLAETNSQLKKQESL